MVKLVLKFLFLFKNIIPKHFVETKNKYKDILDDEINKFNDRRLRNLRLRLIKSRLSLKLMIMSSILSIKYFNVTLENILNGSQVLRAVDDIKKIVIIDNNEENFKNVPKEVFKMLNVLTYENIKEIFENKKKR